MIKTPWIARRIFSNLVWKIPTSQKILYLTFDDGPHPSATPFALDELKKYNAKATFFCLGKNVVKHPSLYEDIINDGHAIGNHTFNHVNGWKTNDKNYFDDVIEARKYMDTSLFRPPYGKITPFQAKHLSKRPFEFSIIMWHILSKDYDIDLTADDCAFNVIRHATKGSIVVFHDSEKAFPRMQKSLSSTLEYFSEKGWQFQSIDAARIKKVKAE
jgi:peptidoglycan/xylan/chitin deacetylase (PgdA/CDA1 family)